MGTLLTASQFLQGIYREMYRHCEHVLPVPELEEETVNTGAVGLPERERGTGILIPAREYCQEKLGR